MRDLRRISCDAADHGCEKTCPVEDHHARSDILDAAGVAVTRDGALLVSDDANGTIFRVTRK